MQYDGKRCSRCFDKVCHKKKKGIFSNKRNVDAAKDYGVYRNDIEWKEDSWGFRKGDESKLSKRMRDEFDEWREIARNDEYVYDGFVVPDDVIEYIPKRKKRRLNKIRS